MFISKYVKVIKNKCEKSVVLYNQYNGAIYLLSEEDYKKLEKKAFIDLTDEMYNDLVEYRFLVDDEIVPILNRNIDTFLITIELSNLCNLNCVYCYQSNQEKRPIISHGILDKVLIYIENVFKNSETTKKLIVGIIGGEPLLHDDLIYYIHSNIQRIASKYDKSFFVHIDTNGTLDFSKLYSAISNVRFSITLSNKNDHNLKRRSDSIDSFETIISNLKKVEIKNNRYVALRYNIDSDNIEDFDEFVEYVRDELPIVNSIEPVYTDEYDFNDYINSLDNIDFRQWNSTSAIDILLKHGFPVTYNLSSDEPILCMAYQPFSCKVYSNGVVTICDSMFPEESKLFIDDIYEDIEMLEKYFYSVKNYDPTEDEKCKNCLEITRCMGRLFCRRQGPCDYERRFSLDELILNYVHKKINNCNLFEI